MSENKTPKTSFPNYMVSALLGGLLLASVTFGMRGLEELASLNEKIHNVSSRLISMEVLVGDVVKERMTQMEERQNLMSSDHKNDITDIRKDLNNNQRQINELRFEMIRMKESG